MKRVHLCLLTFIAFTLCFANPLSSSALNQPKLTDIPAQFSIFSESELNKSVQVFDIKSGKIIKTVPSDATIQKLTNELISSITGLAPELSPDNEAKYIVRIPLETARQIKVGQKTLTVNEIFLFYYNTDHSILLVFDENKKPFLLHYEADIAPLIKHITNSDQ